MSSSVRTSLVVVVSIISAVVVATFAASFWLYSLMHVVQSNGKSVLSVTDFLGAAMWIQAFIALVTFCIIAFGATQIVLLRQQAQSLQEQTKIQHELAEREAYRPLIAPEMVSAKRLLNSKAVQCELGKLADVLQEIDKESKESLQDILDSIRTRFEKISKSMSWPLLKGTYASLDHIEMLIDEYNYLSKLIEDGKLRKDFATELGVANFKRVHERVLPLIRLRRRLSPSYASHFTKYVQTV